jgi:hypothetical protein
VSVDVPRLQQAIRDLHGLDSKHLRTEHVREMFRDKVAWEGDVEVFVVSHPRAGLAYAWEHETDEGNRGFVAVLGVPPVNSAQDAVRAAIAAEEQKRGSR